MLHYKYKAINQKGRIYRGQLDAFNSADLEMRLKKMDLDLINFWEMKNKLPNVSSSDVKRQDLIMIYFHLEQTERAGVPIIDSLSDLRDTVSNSRLSEVLSSMIEAIEGGKMLHESMDYFPKVFSKVSVSLVAAGEESGELQKVFENLTDNLKWQDEQVALTKRLLTYPIIVGCVVSGVLFFLMTYIVPELLDFIQTVDDYELPLHSKALIFLSNLFVDYWYIILCLPIIIVFIVFTLVKSRPSCHLLFDMLLLKLPIIGIILRKMALARLASFFAIMYASGITIIDCIKAAQNIAGNKAIAKAMYEVGEQINNGVSLSKSFEEAKIFPPLVIRMLKVGETTGALQEALLNISYFYTRDVKESIERIQSIIGPLMTLILGAIIFWIVISVLGPIYDLITRIDI